MPPGCSTMHCRSYDAERVETRSLRARILLELGSPRISPRQRPESHHMGPAGDRPARAIALDERRSFPRADGTRILYTFDAGHIAEAEQPLRDALGRINPQAPETFNTLVDTRDTIWGKSSRRSDVSTRRFLYCARTRRRSGSSGAISIHGWATRCTNSAPPCVRAKTPRPRFRSSRKRWLSMSELWPGSQFYVATTLPVWVRPLTAAGRHQEAIDDLLRAQAIYREALGPSHTHTAAADRSCECASCCGRSESGGSGFSRGARHLRQDRRWPSHLRRSRAAGSWQGAVGRAALCGGRSAAQPVEERFIKEFGADDRRAIDAARDARALLAAERAPRRCALAAAAERAALAASNHDVRVQRGRWRKHAANSMRAETGLAFPTLGTCRDLSGTLPRYFSRAPDAAKHARASSRGAPFARKCRARRRSRLRHNRRSSGIRRPAPGVTNRARDLASASFSASMADRLRLRRPSPSLMGKLSRAIATLGRLARQGMADQRMAHRERGGAQKMLIGVPPLGAAQFQVRLVDQCGRLQVLPAPTRARSRWARRLRSS